MDKERRDHLREVVGRVRGIIEASLRTSLARYGLFVDREPLSRADLGVLQPAEEERYVRLLEAMRRHGRAVGQGDATTAPAVDRFVRETGGTWVNRLAALRALEARGLLDPWAAFVSEDYGGLSPRAARLRERAAEQGQRLLPDEAIRAGIEDACLELSAGVRVLFDLSDEQSLAWPDGAALRDVLRAFSSEVSQDDWSQFDVLGWVYQYYNAEANAELKRRKNRTTGFKYRPDDIPIANQFYTPHWVVRVLTDNTLGRLWLEMRERLPCLERQGATGDDSAGYRLVERRRDVPHARDDAEDFRAWIAEEPDPLRDATVDRLCRFLVPLPSEAPPRSPKPVREIRVLDPACGSGHFLLYAFDLLFTMYREAEPELDPRQIPALILEHNLHGIDIDLRAAQLAAFGLYLKARTTLAAVDPKAALALRGLNIVVADAHINDDPRKTQFLESFRSDPDVQALYRRVLHDLDHTNALGSLIKVRTEFETLFGRIRQTRQAPTAFDPAQGVLIETSAQLGLRETYRAQSGRTWTIRELLDELRRFEAEVAPGQDIGARLFYTDVERTVGLLGLLSEQYDVVLMNPPYGDMPAETKDYLKGNKKRGNVARYPRTHHDLATAFIEQGLDLLDAGGFLGGLVPRSFMFLSSFEEMRTRTLSEAARPELLQEYGIGILDGATVRTAGAVIRKAGDERGLHLSAFHRLAYFPSSAKLHQFVATLPTFVATGPSAETDWFVSRLASLRGVPGMPYAYWASDSLRELFTRHPALDRDQAGALVAGRPDVKIADVKQGLATADDARFVRFWWEVDSGSRGYGRRWVAFVKGGTATDFYYRTDLVLNWDGDGRELKEWASHISRGHWSKRIYSVPFYFRPGATWPRASWRLRRFGSFGAGHIFADKGSSIFSDTADAMTVAGLLNSSVGTVAMLMQTPERMWEVGMVGVVPVAPAALASPRVAEVTAALVEHRRNTHAGDETCRDFDSPDLLRLWRQRGGAGLDLATLLEAWVAARRQATDEEARLIQELDREVYRLYEISEADQRLIERELARRPRAEGGYAPGEIEGAAPSEIDNEPADDDDEEDDEPAEPADTTVEAPSALSAEQGRDLVSRWLSYYLKRTIEADPDGIVAVDPIHGQPALILRLMEIMEQDLGREAAHALAQQAPPYLGTKDLAEWAAGGFFPWHVSLYRNRPIFWLLSSENFERGRTQLTFRVYLQYLKLTPDTLPRVLTHYVHPTMERVDREWRLAGEAVARSEGAAKRSAQRIATEWGNTLAAMREFRARMEAVIEGPVHAEPVAASAKWLPRTIAAVTGGRDLGHGYCPDVDFGVRVNIAPLAKNKLLPRAVLGKLGG
jgi:hypothetical protein